MKIALSVRCNTCGIIFVMNALISWCWFCIWETALSHARYVRHLPWGCRSASWPPPRISPPFWQHSATCQGYPCHTTQELSQIICFDLVSRKQPSHSETFNFTVLKRREKEWLPLRTQKWRNGMVWEGDEWRSSL